MNEHSRVCYCGLFRTNDVLLPINTKGLHHHWYSTKGFVSISNSAITCDDELIEDLLKMIDQSIEGILNVILDDGLRTRLVVTSEGVAAFHGEVIYHDKPYKTFKNVNKRRG